MSQSKAEIIMHPIRMKIIQALAGRSLTVQQLKEILPDVPQATLYRHLNKLKKHSIIHVENEQQIRGVVERTYTLDVNNAFIRGNEAKEMSKEEHLRYFMSYFGNLLHQIEEYFEGEVDLEKDGFGYHQLDLFFTDSEYIKFLQDYNELLKKHRFEPTEKRRKRTLAMTFIPEKK